MNDRASFIEIITATFSPGESRIFALTGQYFEIIDATFPVDVTLSDIFGAQRGLMKAAEASFNLKNTSFGVIQITSASAQTIRFAYGTGEAGTRRAAGAVSIVGTVPVDLIAADVDAIRRPELPSGNWKDTSTLAANTPLTVFAPGANVNGALIHMLAAHENFTASHNLVFIAKSSAPASVTDGEVIAQAIMRSVIAGTECMGIDFQQQTRIAAGLGLYLITSGTGAAGRMRSARFSLL